MSGLVVDGVLIPAEKRDLPPAELVAYAAKVREGNGAFVDAYWQLEDRAIALGYASLDELIDEGTR